MPATAQQPKTYYFHWISRTQTHSIEKTFTCDRMALCCMCESSAQRSRCCSPASKWNETKYTHSTLFASRFFFFFLLVYSSYSDSLLASHRRHFDAMKCSYCGRCTAHFFKSSINKRLDSLSVAKSHVIHYITVKFSLFFYCMHCLQKRYWLHAAHRSISPSQQNEWKGEKKKKEKKMRFSFRGLFRFDRSVDVTLYRPKNFNATVHFLLPIFTKYYVVHRSWLRWDDLPASHTHSYMYSYKNRTF